MFWLLPFWNGWQCNVKRRYVIRNSKPTNYLVRCNLSYFLSGLSSELSARPVRVSRQQDSTLLKYLLVGRAVSTSVLCTCNWLVLSNTALRQFWVEICLNKLLDQGVHTRLVPTTLNGCKRVSLYKYFPISKILFNGNT